MSTESTMAAIEDGVRIIVPKHVVSKEVGGDLVLLDLNGGTYFKLNTSAFAFWRKMADGLTFGESLRQLDDQFNVPRDRLRAEMASLLRDLIQERLAEMAQSQDDGNREPCSTERRTG